MPARLHHERIEHSEGTPARWMLLTHGIYGAGSNWRGIARKLVDRRRDWGVVLVDLRHHGKSDAGDPPHTLEACAEDIRALVGELELAIPVIAGHSFGGKVMLAARSLIEVEQTWLFDSSPSALPGALEDSTHSVVRVLHLLERLSPTWTTREDFVAAVIADGHDNSLAQWLAMNLLPTDGGFTNRLDPTVLHALLASYFDADLWPAVADASRGRLEVVIATRSNVIGARERDQLAHAGEHVHAHEVDAGHWLHVEAAPAVIELLATELP